MREMGYGRGYQYAHDYPEGRVAQQHLPDILSARQYYRPGTLGMEPRIATRPTGEGSAMPDSRAPAK
jgi:putative ATPase